MLIDQTYGWHGLTQDDIQMTLEDQLRRNSILILIKDMEWIFLPL